MNITNEKKNVLLKRTEVSLSFPGLDKPLERKAVKTQVAKHFKVEEDLVIVNHVKTHFGSRDVEVEAYVYDSKEALEKVTPKHTLKRNTEEVAESEE